MWNQTTDPRKLRYIQVGDYEVAVNTCAFGLELYIRGFGGAGMTHGQGAPILLHLRADEIKDEGHPLLYVWDNINDEDPSHRIDLAGAAEARNDQSLD